MPVRTVQKVKVVKYGKMKMGENAIFGKNLFMREKVTHIRTLLCRERFMSLSDE